MNANLKKLSFALLGLAMAGAAHAVPIVTTINLNNPSQSDTIFNNPNYSPDQSSSAGSDLYYSLVLPSASAATNMSIIYDGTVPNGHSNPNQPVAYTVWTATNITGSSATKGTEVGSTTMPPSTSWLLTLAADTNYILEVVLNAKTYSAASIISGTISAVPLPGTALLFGTALLGGLGFVRRRGQKGNAVVAA